MEDPHSLNQSFTKYNHRGKGWGKRTTDIFAWLQLMKKNIHEAEYVDIAEHQQLMNAYIQYMQRIGDETGAVRLRHGEQVPNGAYKREKLVNRGPLQKPRSLSGHVKLRCVVY